MSAHPDDEPLSLSRGAHQTRPTSRSFERATAEKAED